MRKAVLYIISLTIIYLLSVTSVLARSGCCSYHGGVCGCGCCDGTSLSSICAPYYPECNQERASQLPFNDFPTNTPYLPPPTSTPLPPTFTPIPSPTNAPKIEITLTTEPTLSPYSPSTTTSTQFDMTGGACILAAIGGLGYWIFKGRK